MRKIFVAILLVLSLTAAALAQGYDCSGRYDVCPMSKFSDLDENIWCHEGLDFVISHGYMKGKTEDRFVPDGSMTRAMVIAVLYRIAEDTGKDVKGASSLPFKDVSNDAWFYKELCWAYKNNIAKGFTDTKFAPNRTVTREQITLFLSRFAVYIGEEVKASGDISRFSDVSKLSAESKKAISWAVSEGILNGYPNGELRPKATATRAHFAVMIQRWLSDECSQHSFGLKEVSVMPTCTEDGRYVQACSVCGYKLTGVIPATGHHYGEKKIGTAASCTRTGTYVKICENCGDVLVVEPIPKREHSFREKQIKAATCTETGTVQKTCTVCGLTYTETVPMTAHNFENGKCACGACEMTAVKISTPGDGDRIVIYNPSGKVCMGSATANNKLSCVNAVVSGDTLGYAANDGVSVLTAEKSGSGFYLKNTDGKYLSTYSTGESLFFSSINSNALWILDGGRIKNSTAVYDNSPQYIECYAGSFTCYGYSSKNPDHYLMELYKVK